MIFFTCPRFLTEVCRHVDRPTFQKYFITFFMQYSWSLERNFPSFRIRLMSFLEIYFSSLLRSSFRSLHLAFNKIQSNLTNEDLMIPFFLLKRHICIRSSISQTFLFYKLPTFTGTRLTLCNLWGASLSNYSVIVTSTNNLLLFVHSSVFPLKIIRREILYLTENTMFLVITPLIITEIWTKKKLLATK